MRWIMITKATMVVIFNLQNSHVLTLSLPTEEVFQVNSQNRPVTNLPVGDFHSQSREMPTFKPLKLNFRFFFWYIVFFPFLESLNFTVSQRYRFFSVLTATIRESSDKLPCIENREGFAVHSSTWPSGAKGEWRVSSWLAISTHVEKITIVFPRVLLRLFSRPEILL